MSTAWILAMPFLLALLMLTMASKALHGSWYAPGSFFAAVWLLYLLLPLIFAHDFYVWWGAVLAILLAVLAVNVGSLLGVYFGQGNHCSQPLSYKERHRLIPLLIKFTLWGMLSGLVSIWVTMAHLGQSVSTLFSLSGLVEAAAQIRLPVIVITTIRRSLRSY